MKVYLISWIIASLVALALIIKDRRTTGFLSKAYVRFLLKPWKVITFLIAGTVMTLAAPYSGDYTWDYTDGSIMSVLTFITAPWTTGVLYRFYKKKVPLRQVYAAFCLAMFSFSWFYDGYILLRDGDYPETWYTNIVLSSFLYFSAGALWNLEAPPGQRTGFAFHRDAWFNEEVESSFGRILWISLPLILLGGGIIGLFVINYFFGIFR